jgi:hypothetical protein
MAKYSDDRSFTNFVHSNLAIPIIYKPLAWTEKEVDATFLEFIDINEGVDYLFKDKAENEIKIQERFRDDFYKNYNDCTLRYRRDLNADASRHASEFFKIKADYLVYGITNGAKFADKRHTLTGFVKFVVVDLKVLFSKINEGLIIPKHGGRSSRIEDGKIISPIIDNKDDSSSFVAFDVSQLKQMFGNEGIILIQKGFY